MRRQPKASVHGRSEVMAAVLVFYAVTGLLTARCLAHWASRLPDSKAALVLRQVADRYWGRTAALGLEVPEDTLERLFLRVRDADPREAPRRYAEEQARRRDRQAQKAAGVKPKWPQKVVEGEVSATRLRGPRALILGDSIMMKVGPEIRRNVEAHLGGVAVVNAQLSTGLARPDLYDWVKELQRSLQGRRFDVVIMMLGTNDSQDFTEGGRFLTYGTTDWIQAYNRRLAALMDVACKGAEHGLWIGLPPMRDERFNGKALRINTWAQHQAEIHPCMTYIPLEGVLGDAQGRFASYLKIDDRLAKVRTIDGIHVTAQGGSLVAEALLARLMAH